MKDAVEVEIDSILLCYWLHKGVYQCLGKSATAYVCTGAIVQWFSTGVYRDLPGGT